MKKIFIILTVIISCLSFVAMVRFENDKPVPIPASKQRSGNAAEGYKYLTTGDYVKGGIPYDFFKMGNYSKVLLKREGLNEKVPHDFTVVKATNGENLVAPNCMQCHAQVFDSTLYIGMGNTFIDFTTNLQMTGQAFVMMERLLKNSPTKYAASQPFLEVMKTITPGITTKVRGVNAADRLTQILVAHRDPETFRWVSAPSIDIPELVVPSDVPAWWLLKKKNAMFYTGFGRGDFGRFLMASNLLTVNDTAESREVDNRISDVLAYIKSIEPPRYPHPIDEALAEKGRIVFNSTCSKCHGEPDDYPNLLIPASLIKTDSLLYTSNYQNPAMINWFNKSWFAKGDHPARLEPFRGYIAPPLDGVWVTGPYLHNGSVPTIAALLNSKIRPKYWQRDFNAGKYDYDNLGWVYTAVDKPGGNTVYNTELPGYGNQGHYFGDKLDEEERTAVIEYLKKL